MPTQRTKVRVRVEAADPGSLERGVRQLLADKVSGTMAGLWLLIPEHLRLGTWDTLCGWCGQPGGQVEPRLALQLVHEAALCVNGVRQGRSLSQKGFELAHGLPFVASDQAIHDLLDAHTVAQAQQLQWAWGALRRNRGHFPGRLLAVDPHRLKSCSKRQFRRHLCGSGQDAKPQKCSQSFFLLDAHSNQPVCLVTGSASRTATWAAGQLLELGGQILQPDRPKPLVLADSEHFTLELFEEIIPQSGFDLLVPMPNRASHRRRFQQIPEQDFQRQWAGLALAVLPRQRPEGLPPVYELVQRCGERPGDYTYKGFWSTTEDLPEEQLTVEFPQRWHIETFFHDHQQLGWKRAGTQNLNIRYGQMSLALLAQGALHELRQRLGEPFLHCQAPTLAKNLLSGLDGDIRVRKDTIILTYYNAPHADRLAPLFQGLPQILAAEGIDPHIPWLYGFKLDFRFK